MTAFKNNGRLLTNERRKRILALLEAEGSLSADRLTEIFGVSHMTIWRDLTALEESGSLLRIHGGATKLDITTSREPLYKTKRVINRAKKDTIARYAANTFVNNGDIIILEAGTTVLAMVKFLKHQDLTVVTNGLGTLSELAPAVPDINVMCCGGMLRDVSLTFVGPQAIQYFQSIRADIFFLGVTGLAFPEGITDPNVLEIQVKQAMAASAERIIVLLDSTKFGKRSLMTILPLEEIDVIVTDADAPQEFVVRLRDMSIDVHVVK